MPAKSEQQFKFMKGVAGGSIKAPGLSPEKADEFTAGQSPKGLPHKVKKHKKPHSFGSPMGMKGMK